MIKIFYRIILVALLQAAPAWAIPIGPENTVTVNGVEWAQAALFTNTTWSTFSAACPAGLCSGELTANGITYDLSGWRWASTADVNSLFNIYLAAGGVQSQFLLGPDDGGFIWTTDTAAATIFYDDNWVPTLIEFGLHLTTAGYMSDSYISPVDGSLQATVASVLLEKPAPPCQYWCNVSPSIQRFSTQDASSTPQVPRTDLGAWFFKSPAPAAIETPPTLLLLGLGVGGLGFVRRQRRTAAFC